MKQPRLPVEVRLDIDAQKLPAAVEPVLLKIMATVAKIEEEPQEIANRIEKGRAPDYRRVIRVIPLLKRNIRKARADLSSLKTLLNRLRPAIAIVDPDPDANRREDDAFAGIELRLDALQERIAPRPAGKGRGAPGVPEHFYEFGAVAVLELQRQGVGPVAAANAVTACLRPILPKRGSGVTPYKFAGRLLLEWMRARS